MFEEIVMLYNLKHKWFNFLFFCYLQVKRARIDHNDDAGVDGQGLGCNRYVRRWYRILHKHNLELSGGEYIIHFIRK